MRNRRLFLLPILSLLAGMMLCGGLSCHGASSPTEPFSAVPSGLPGAGIVSLAWGDYDGDGDLDLALSGYSPNDLDVVSRIYRNDGGLFTDIGAGLKGLMAGAVAWGDYDGDGDLDLVISGADLNIATFTKIYRNDAGIFTDIGAGLPGVIDSALAWGDYDNDGDLDLALAGNAFNTPSLVSAIYRNDGGGIFTDISAGLAVMQYDSSVSWEDFDNDGDLDLTLSGRPPLPSGPAEVLIYRNDATVFTDIGAGLTGVWGTNAWGDYDGDGDLDVALHNYSTARAEYVGTIMENNGGVLTEASVWPMPVWPKSLAWGDYDNDGDLDLGMAGYSDDTFTRTNYAAIYENSSGTFVDVGADLVPVGETFAWGDFDNDGDLDVVLSGELGTVGSEVVTVWPPVYRTELFRNNTFNWNTAPTAPGNLSAFVGSGNDVTFSWTAATDNETPQPALSYNLRVGTSPGANDVMPSMSDPVTGKRLIPAMGNVQHNPSWTLGPLPAGTYYWSVQAVDTGYEGSAWPPEQSIAVP